MKPTPLTTNEELRDEVDDIIKQLLDDISGRSGADWATEQDLLYIETTVAKIQALLDQQTKEARIDEIDSLLKRTEKFPNGYWGISTRELAHRLATLTNDKQER